jgi:spore coat polysaccharide biosynthesis predicted glycosyltransferase SpsG/RimJ/RimL family protein N-acetyltransferase
LIDYWVQENWIIDSSLKNQFLESPFSIIDSYTLPLDEIEFIETNSIRTLHVIDDIKSKTSRTGLFLLPSIVDNLTLYSAQIMTGPNYALVRKEVLNLKEDYGIQFHNPNKNKVLLSLGSNPSPKIIETIIKTIFANSQYEVVLFAGNSAIEALSKIDSTRIEFVSEDINKLKPILPNVAFAISNAGVSSTEMIYLAIPVISIALVDNQLNQFNQHNKIGILSIDYSNFDFESTLKSIIKQLQTSQFYEKYRQTISELSNKINTDGPKLIIESFLDLGSSLNLTPATLNHSDFLYELRNDSTVRFQSKNSTTITREDHDKWLSDKILKKTTKIYIIKINETNVGQVRVDLKDSVGIVSVALIEKYRGYGLAKVSLKKLISIVRETSMPISFLHAEIKAGNVNSIGLFTSLGFKEISENEDKTIRTYCLEI